jgi:peptidyl-prolyl cis-trans isomerase SurA
MRMPSNDVLISQLMERLILESIQLQDASRRGVEIDDETLTRAVIGFAQQNGMDLDQFQVALAQDGMSYREFREEIRREMVISRLQRNLVGRRVNISEKEVQELMNSPYYQQLLSDEFRVGHILLEIDPAAGDDVVGRARAKADEIVRELRAGADFQQMAIAESAGSQALEGGDLGWRRAGELPTLFAEDVLSMNVGDTADPISSSSGIHIIHLLEKRGAGTQRQMQSEARHILVQPSEIRTPEETEALANDIYRRLGAGEDFCALAEAYSQDPGTALNCGDLGWTGGDQFVPEFAAVMSATPVGGRSEPFRTQYGWHVIEVIGRRDQDLSEEARRNMALQILHQRRFDEELQEWLKEIRDEAFVEMRL